MLSNSVQQVLLYKAELYKHREEAANNQKKIKHELAELRKGEAEEIKVS